MHPNLCRTYRIPEAPFIKLIINCIPRTSIARIDAAGHTAATRIVDTPDS